jgi:hypothetical protein
MSGPVCRHGMLRCPVRPHARRPPPHARRPPPTHAARPPRTRPGPHAAPHARGPPARTPPGRTRAARPRAPRTHAGRPTRGPHARGPNGTPACAGFSRHVLMSSCPILPVLCRGKTPLAYSGGWARAVLLSPGAAGRLALLAASAGARECPGRDECGAAAHRCAAAPHSSPSWRAEGRGGSRTGNKPPTESRVQERMISTSDPGLGHGLPGGAGVPASLNGRLLSGRATRMRRPASGL